MALCLLAGHAAVGAAGSGSDDVPEPHVMLSGWPLVLVREAIHGAMRRMDDPTCRQILTDFQDDEGQSLAANLHASGMSAKQYLAALRFVDGSDLDQCEAYPSRVAVTQRRSRVIFVCASHFQSKFPGKRSGSQTIVLHEMLHSLGLGENPPTSAQITRRVAERCEPN